MEILDHIVLGFSVASSLINLLYCFIGVLLGTVVGILPGLGPMGAVAILLPFMYSIGDPVTSIIFLSGIYYGAQYGGSTTAILLNLPGEPSSLVTTIDGFQMSRNGRAGAALSIVAVSSFIGGTVATLFIAMLAVPLAEIAFLFGSTEYAALMATGLLASVALSQGSFLKGLAMLLTGVLLGTVGTDINSGVLRFTFGIFNLADGISFVVIAMGVFGLGEILYNYLHEKELRITVPKLKNLYPTKQEIKEAIPSACRGTLIGSIMGLIPGAGTILSSFAGYIVEKKISRNPEKFGKGAVEGISSPEAANNAGSQTGFIPMLSLGIPTTPMMAMMLAALIINNIQPGPSVISNHPFLFWGLIASMWIGNIILVILNLPLVGIWVKILQIPRVILYPLITLTCIAGTYYVNNNWFETWLLLPMCLAGYLFKVLKCEPAPLAMGFVIGVFFEEHLRRALTISQGNWIIFIESPISLTLLMISLITMIGSIFFKSRRQ